MGLASLAKKSLKGRAMKRYTLEQCEASAANFETRSEWQAGDPLIYCAVSRRPDWLEHCMPSSGRKYTLELLQLIAGCCKDKDEWRRKHINSYRYAQKQELIDDLKFNTIWL